MASSTEKDLDQELADFVGDSLIRSGDPGDSVLPPEQARQREEAHQTRLEQIETRIQNLQVILLTPLIAVFFMVIIPDAILDLVHSDNTPPHDYLEILAGGIMGTALLTLLWQIRQHRNVMVFVLAAILFLAASQVCRFGKEWQGLDTTLFGRWYNFSHTLDNAFNGIGLVLLGGAGFYAFVELLAAREREKAERERLTQEVKDRIRAEQALVEREELFRSISVSAQDAIIMVNNELRVVYWNPAAERILGHTREEVVGSVLVPLLIPEAFTHLDLDDAASIRRRITFAAPGKVEEFTLRHKAGHDVVVEVTTNSLTLGNEWHGLAIVRDITERKKTEQLLQDRQVQMVNNARLSSLGVMASGLAHEINNPLAIISMAIQELNEALQETPARLDQVTRIVAYVERNVLRIERILRGLRNLSREGGGEPFLDVALKSVIEDTLELCQARYRMRGVLLDIQEIPSDLVVQCRATQISQILLNLLNNAYDAVEDFDERWVLIEVYVEDGMVEIAVVDSGKGIPEEIGERILEPFYTTKEVGRGTGLGLSITRSLIEAHRGELLLDTYNGNTRFRVRIPKTQREMEQTGKAAENE